MDRSTFYEDVYEVVKLIPEGRVTSYGAIAAYLGTKSSSRMVGYALSAVAGLNEVPAHRVVNRNGLLTGKFHFGPNNEMQKLLTSEGVRIEEDRVINFKTLFWDPAISLEL